jgi:hypothetical protein
VYFSGAHMLSDTLLSGPDIHLHIMITRQCCKANHTAVMKDKVVRNEFSLYFLQQTP